MSTLIVTVDELEAHLNLIAGEADSAFLTSKIEAAQACVEGFIGTTFDTFDAIPAPLREAVLQLAAHFHENREPVVIGSEKVLRVPLSVFDLVGPFKTWTF